MKNSAIKQQESGIIADLSSLFSVMNTRKTKIFLYGFVFAFVACTAYLAFFNPSGNNSGAIPWFNNLFNSAAVSTAPYRSHISNFFSSIFPNSSSLPSPELGIGFRVSGVTGNQTRIGVSSGGSGDPAKKQGNSSVENQAGSGNHTGIVADLTGNGATKNNLNKESKEGAGSKNQNGVDGESTKKDGDSTKQTVNATPAGNGVSTKKNGNLTPNCTPPSGNGVTATKVSNNTNASKKDGALSSKTQKGSVGENKNQSVTSVPVVSSAAKSQNQTTNGKSSNGDKLKEIKQKGGATTSPSQANGPSSSKGHGAPPTKSSIGVTKVSNLTASLVQKASNGEMKKKDDWIKSMIGCDIFQGKWVKDDSYPLYPEGSCPHIDEPFNCYLNGRPDRAYQKLRWQPNGCKTPRLNATDMLERLRGKRLVFVGDSLNRNMWESLVCVLRHSIKDKSKVFEASGKQEFRTEGSYSFLFTDYNCSVEFFRSPFLVQEWEMRVSNGTTKETLRLDLIENSSPKYKDADVLVFNTGHWWTHEKTSKGKDYYQEGNHVYSELNVVNAFHKALNTWAKWIDSNVNSKKTVVLFRGYSASHFSGGQWNSGGQCDKETEPIKNENYLSSYPPKMTILEQVIKGMKTPVVYLNITRMTDYRKDAHPSIYRKQSLTEEERRSPERYQDCSHWCLPGVPDSWNELLYAQILIKQYQMVNK